MSCRHSLFRAGIGYRKFGYQATSEPGFAHSASSSVTPARLLHGLSLFRSVRPPAYLVCCSISASRVRARSHPLVLLNMSDHHTRFKAQLAGQEPPRVLGCLLGSHTARTVEICNSFEVTYESVVDGVPQVNLAFLTQKQEQCARPPLPVRALLSPLAQTRKSSPSWSLSDGTPPAAPWWTQTWSCSAWFAPPLPARLLARSHAPLAAPDEQHHGERRLRPLQPQRLGGEGAPSHALRVWCVAL